MITDSALEAGRTRAESLMQDACTITVRGVGEPVYDPVTNTSVPPQRRTIYTGKCRIRSQRKLLTGSQASVAGAADVITQVDAAVSIPVDAAIVPKAAIITITDSAHDPANIGRVFAVNAVLHETQAMAMKMQCIEEQLEEAS